MTQPCHGVIDRALACAGFMYLLPIDMVKHSSASAEPKGRRRALLGWLGLPRPPAWTKCVFASVDTCLSVLPAHGTLLS